MWSNCRLDKKKKTDPLQFETPANLQPKLIVNEVGYQAMIQAVKTRRKDQVVFLFILHPTLPEQVWYNVWCTFTITSQSLQLKEKREARLLRAQSWMMNHHQHHLWNLKLCVLPNNSIIDFLTTYLLELAPESCYWRNQKPRRKVSSWKSPALSKQVYICI